MIATLLTFAQIAIAVSGPDTVSVREPATVTVEVSTPGTVLPRVVPPSFFPLGGAYSGGSERVEVRNGERRTTVVHRYAIVAATPGTYRVPPFRALLGSSTAESRPLTLVVRDPLNDPRSPSIIATAPLDPTAGVNFRAAVAPETVYVGQQATLEVGVFLDDEVRARLRRNPEFIPPEPRSMLAYDVPVPARAVPARRAGNRRYEAHVFQRALFPLTPGRALIPPARLIYSLPLGSSFFSREESHTLLTDTLSVVALEPPVAGRPAGYTGAVGDLAVAARTSASRARVGDPIVFTVSVSGSGNVKLFPRPALSIPGASVVRAEERVRLDPPSAVVRGRKEFDWIVTPRRAGTLEIGALRYPYFDPVQERYEIAVTRPTMIAVAPGTLADADTASGDTLMVLPLRATLRADVGEPISSHPAFWLAALLAPVPAAALGVVRRPRRRVIRSAAQTLRTLAGASGVGPAELRRAYVGALSSRLALAPAVLTRRGGLARALRRAGVTRDVAADAELLLDELDRAAYSGAGVPAGDAARRAADLFVRVDAEARGRTALAARTVAVLLVAAGAALATAGAVDARDESTAYFARGVRAYEARRFAEAAEEFGAVARRRPAAPDAWANFGTSAWMAGDSAAAAVGWQRALRLEPLATDLRSRLALLSAPQEGLVAGVPPLPVSPAAGLALAAWLVAWGTVAWRVRRRVPTVPPLGWAAFVAAVTLGAAAAYATTVREADDRAVIAEGGPLRALPALAADPSATVMPGDVARTTERRGVWTRVQLEGDREGWVETDRLVPLGFERGRG